MFFQARKFSFARRSHRGDEVDFFGWEGFFDALVIQNESGEVKSGSSRRREEAEGGRGNPPPYVGGYGIRFLTNALPLFRSRSLPRSRRVRVSVTLARVRVMLKVNGSSLTAVYWTVLPVTLLTLPR